MKIQERAIIYWGSKQDILNECRIMFGEHPPAAFNPQWNPREFVRSLKVPVVYVNGGRDPWKALCLDNESTIPKEDYFLAPEGYHCPDKYNPDLGKKVLDRMLHHIGK